MGEFVAESPRPTDLQRYIAARVLLLLPTMVGVASIVFALLHLTPGDPVDLMLGETAVASDRAALRRDLGLDRPLGTQYLGYLAGLARGDLGTSLHSGRAVRAVVLERLPATLGLAASASCVALCFALPAGFLAARRPNGLFDQVSLGVSLLGAAIPNFWLGPVLILVFAIALGWLPVSGTGTLAHAVLPSITLGASLAGILARMGRASLLEVMHDDYIRTARAKGLGESTVIVRHAAPNAVTPVLSLVGLQLGALLGGSVITETIFAWPGIGRLTIEAIHTRDYPVVQGCVLTIAASYVLVNLLTDAAYAAADPRIRLDREA